MDAGQIFPTCREGYRLKKNPEKANENVAFLAANQYWKNPKVATQGEWQSFNSPDKMLTNVGTNAWMITTGPYGDYIVRPIINSVSQDFLNVKHMHVNETGELYLRLQFHIGQLYNDQNGKRQAIFSICPEGRPYDHPDVAVYLIPASDVAFTIRFEWIAADGSLVGVDGPHMIRSRDSYRVMDWRLYIPAPEKGEKGYARGRFLSSVSYTFGADFDPADTPPLGFKDTAEEKRIAWCAIGSQFVQQWNTISPMRLGIGNKINEALP